MKTILWIALFIILFITGIRYIERRGMYFPMKDIAITPDAVGLPYEEVYFETSDKKRLSGWFIPNGRARFTVIFSHGNAGNISHRIDKILLLHRLGVNIFIFDYRGYGKSEGRPSEEGLYKDASAAYDYLTDERKISKEDIILYGESIGGAVAIDLAQKRYARALITEETLTSVRAIAKTIYPFIPHFLFSNRFDSISKIKGLSCSKLIIHSVDDEIVPFRLGERLFNAAGEPKRFLRIRGTHNEAFLDSKVQFAEGIKAFLDSL